VPTWVILASYGAIGLGTLSGGWRIVETMGMRITKLQPVGGFCAETAGALALFGASAAASRSRPRTPSPGDRRRGIDARLSAVKMGRGGRILGVGADDARGGLVAAIAFLIVRQLRG